MNTTKINDIIRIRSQWIFPNRRKKIKTTIKAAKLHHTLQWNQIFLVFTQVIILKVLNLITLVKKYAHENQQNFDSIPKAKVRKDPSKMMINPSKGPMQGYPEVHQNQIYVIRDSKKVSDQRKQQPIKLNNAVNIQTAIRSIRSDD